MTSGWQVRQAVANDIGRLALIGAATFLETFAGILDGSAIVMHCQTEHSSKAYREYLKSGGAAWLAETSVSGAPIGFALVASCSLPGSDPEGGDLELKRIYLLSRFHGSGLGTELMRQALQFARKQEAGRLLLGVYVGNTRAIAFYRKQGFVKVADRQFRVGDHKYDDVVLAKRLA